MKITKISSFTGVEHTLDLPCTQEQIDRWQGGELIQDAMPQMTPDQREFLITGCTAEEWQNMFGGSDDE